MTEQKEMIKKGEYQIVLPCLTVPSDQVSVQISNSTTAVLHHCSTELTNGQLCVQLCVLLIKSKPLPNF